MLDIKFLRTNFAEIKANIARRQKDYPSLNEFEKKDSEWKSTATKLQALSTERNKISAEIAILVKENKKEMIEQLKNRVQALKVDMEDLQKKANELEVELKTIMFSIPNILDESVPNGKDENDNVVVKTYLEPKEFSFTPLSHWELGIKNKWLDFERGVKVSGSRMYYINGRGAEIMRALRNFTLDLHIKNGYTEVLPPVIMNDKPFYGLGKLPLFEEDMYQTTNRQFLSGTEEHPLTAMYMDETLDGKELPIKLTSSLVSFRKEAGSAGKDTKGILRVHQFYNTELVNFALPNDSWKLLDEMVLEVQKVLELLEIPYRTMLLCSGDTGDSAAKTFDIEVWVPSEKKYREISSCSNVLDYQSRGMHIKYNLNKEVGYVHTLNGTGTSLNRLLIAIMENFQQEDGTIAIPKALLPYLNSRI